MSRRGAVGVVFRAPKRDRNGDPVDDQGNVIRVGANGTKVGTIEGILVGGKSASPKLAMQESSDTSSQIGIPNRKNLIRVEFGDRIFLDGVVYKVVSPPLWTYSNTRTGTKPEYTWYQVDGTVDASLR